MPGAQVTGPGYLKNRGDIATLTAGAPPVGWIYKLNGGQPDHDALKHRSDVGTPGSKGSPIYSKDTTDSGGIHVVEVQQSEEHEEQGICGIVYHIVGDFK